MNDIRLSSTEKVLFDYNRKALIGMGYSESDADDECWEKILKIRKLAGMRGVIRR
jgi:hypothetical protein